MRERILKLSKVSALRNQLESDHANSPSELIIPSPIAPTSALQQVPLSTSNSPPQDKSSSARNRRSPSYYGFEDSSPEQAVTAPPKRPRRAGDVKNIRPANVSGVKTVQTTDEISVTPVIGTASPLDSQVCALADQRTPTFEEDVISVMVYAAENRDKSDNSQKLTLF